MKPVILFVLLILVATPAFGQVVPPFMFSWDVDNDGNIALDGMDNVYINGDGTAIVKKFAADGTFLEDIDTGTGGIWDLDVDPDGTIWVLRNDTYPNVVTKVSPGGTITTWNTLGGGGTDEHVAIASDGMGSIYIANHSKKRIDKYGDDGAFLFWWGQAGSTPGRFEEIRDILATGNGIVYVVEAFGNRRIQRFTSGGHYLSMFDFGTLFNPLSVDIDNSNNLYISAVNIVKIYDQSGNLLTEWGNVGTGDGLFYGFEEIAVNSNGDIYTAETSGTGGNGRIQVFGGATLASTPVESTSWGRINSLYTEGATR